MQEDAVFLWQQALDKHSDHPEPLDKEELLLILQYTQLEYCGLSSAGFLPTSYVKYLAELVREDLGHTK